MQTLMVENRYKNCRICSLISIGKYKTLKYYTQIRNSQPFILCNSTIRIELHFVKFVKWFIIQPSKETVDLSRNFVLCVISTISSTWVTNVSTVLLAIIQLYYVANKWVNELSKKNHAGRSAESLSKSYQCVNHIMKRSNSRIESNLEWL